ncbi:MAG: hypothetical protein COB54_07980 [Alphaproteobacteria bacterium]|nr:MAG: hypothetical protein COB54_07980 [Alphaproteobacteria bacterium]
MPMLRIRPSKRKGKFNDSNFHFGTRLHFGSSLQEARPMELGAYFQFVMALLFVLALILLIAYGAKRFGLMARVTVNSTKTRDKRLNIVEILPIDARRKLMLIRRDDVEHLVILGTERDIVIETDITAKAGKTEK